ncbi:GerAB/ArcD/ProY family transporter, partial [Domibacillus aminovorans]|uniref:GerAB/ArcD/ProY family transporter n=1 Tax=Domibacillus aminovorans TaxID=29332 RepID=UPI000ACBCF5D
MEKAKISAYQLFTLILLFELGSALVLPLASEAKQGAWLAILIAMAGGFCLFFIHYGLYRYYPGLPPTEYMQTLLGSVLRKIIAFLYILYFVYTAAGILRPFGELLVTIAYPDTPIFVINALFILMIIYTVYKGIEVISRTVERYNSSGEFGFNELLESGGIRVERMPSWALEDEKNPSKTPEEQAEFERK